GLKAQVAGRQFGAQLIDRRRQLAADRQVELTQLEFEQLLVAPALPDSGRKARRRAPGRTTRRVLDTRLPPGGRRTGGRSGRRRNREAAAAQQRPDAGVTPAESPVAVRR